MHRSTARRMERLAREDLHRSAGWSDTFSYAVLANERSL